MMGLETYPVAWPLGRQQPYLRSLAPKPWSNLASPPLTRWTQQAPAPLEIVSIAFKDPNTP